MVIFIVTEVTRNHNHHEVTAKLAGWLMYKKWRGMGGRKKQRRGAEESKWGVGR